METYFMRESDLLLGRDERPVALLKDINRETCVRWMFSVERVVELLREGYILEVVLRRRNVRHVI